MELSNQKGELDRQWYLRKLNRAIKDRLPELVTHAAVMGAPKGQRIRLAVQKLEEPDFRFQPDTRSANGGHTGLGAGDNADVLWIELTTEEIMNLLLEDLKLPRLVEKSGGSLQRDEVRYDDVTVHGPLSNVDKRRSLYEAAKEGRDYLTAQDLRFRTWKEHPKPITAAVITLVRDASGSMDETKRYLSKATAWWLVEWIRQQYAASELLFFLHTTEPLQVDEDTFFNREITGGTAITSTYRTIVQLWEDSYAANDFNRYLLHFSDGDIWHGADASLANSISHILATASLLGYFEIQGLQSRSPLWTILEQHATIDGNLHPAMRMARINQRDDVLPAIRAVIGANS
ncbi:MAG: hypothetical protein C7B45_12105 [Sulfobacillus acidophilus]|uniref:DUF444 family protein n=1 Tax=Sulfobacillus acidophilus TaxID=53633 RepID=A0A2T2WFS4_9FIRM|nr:MAG: hypothetical protein C7B45_12105 [Sulfobacillus acidophilus]